MDLSRVECQAGERDPALLDRHIAAPALRFQLPALLEFPVGIVFDVPSWSKSLERRHAIGPGARAGQGPASGLSRGIRLSLANQACPQAGLPSAMASGRLHK